MKRVLNFATEKLKYLLLGRNFVNLSKIYDIFIFNIHEFCYRSDSLYDKTLLSVLFKIKMSHQSLKLKIAKLHFDQTITLDFLGKNA